MKRLIAAILIVAALATGLAAFADPINVGGTSFTTMSSPINVGGTSFAASVMPSHAPAIGLAKKLSSLESLCSPINVGGT